MIIETLEVVIEELKSKSANIESIAIYPILDEITKPKDSHKKFRQIGKQIVFKIIDEKSNEDEN